MNFDNTETEAEALAANVLTIKDLRKMDATGLSADEFLREEHGVDPAEHDTESELRAAVLSARKLNGDPENKGTEPHTDDAEPETEHTDTERSLGVSIGATDLKEYGDSKEDVAALSESVMTVSDWREADRTDTSPRAYVGEQYGVDPAEFRDESKLREAINEENQ